MRTGEPYIGRYFGNYQVMAKIDCGAFGCVYQAQHAFLPRVAAIKLLDIARLRSKEARKEFLQEAQILERLKHPYILQIYEFGLDDGLPYLITEYASRGSLRGLLNSRSSQPLHLRDATLIITQIGEALYFAHQQGVIHHDLKPENILFNERNDALLADFGIAIVRTTTTLEQIADVKVKGTPAYMAPEQFQGKASRRSDQYALGCILYELVTGSRPFTAPDVISMGLRHMREAPIPPTRLNPNLPAQVDYVILKALEKRRINRYSDVLTFIQELQTLATRTPVLTRRRANTLVVIEKTKERHLNEGIQFYLLGLYWEALAAFEQTLRLDPHFAYAYFAKGNALYFLGRYEDALLAFGQAIRLDPNYAAFHNNKGCILYALGRNREALAAYNQALRLNPHYANARQGKRLALRRLGRLS
jgi:serine/threonine protein kinase